MSAPPRDHSEIGLTKGPGLYTKTFGGTAPLDPTMVHPTAATELPYNRNTAPFIFLVTGLPEDFREWLVSTGIHEVDSHLSVLFVENGIPIPHNYVTALTNYNMRTDSDLLRERAHQRVHKSVVDLLFNKPSNTSRRIAEFIRINRDNLDDAYSGDQARLFVRNSVAVTSLDVTVPGTKITTTVYNVYIHPLTANWDLLDHWRKWIANQKFHADTSGVGVKYKYLWRCLHCKTIDHPSGLCAIAKNVKGRAKPQDKAFTAVEELLPLGPTPGPSRQNQTLTQGKRGDIKGKGVTVNTAAKAKRPAGPTKSIRATGSKKRKVN